MPWRGKQTGFMVNQHGEVCHKLMQKLGYEQYGKNVFFTYAHSPDLPLNRSTMI